MNRLVHSSPVEKKGKENVDFFFLNKKEKETMSTSASRILSPRSGVSLVDVAGSWGKSCEFQVGAREIKKKKINKEQRKKG